MMTRPKRSSLQSVVSFTVAVSVGTLITGAARVQAYSDGTSQKVWADRGPIENLDLYWGNASPDRKPAGPFTFIREDIADTNPKALVRDARGALWGVKWGDEVQAEVAATRLAWAMGLGVEETYYVEAGRILFPGARPTFQRIGSYIDKTGQLKSAARFERRAPGVVSKGVWTFDKNPLRADTGFSVMVLMNVVMGNWDAKDSNNKILSVTDASGTTDWYLIGDYGACFGKMGGLMSHSKYELKDFVKSPPVIASVTREAVYLGYKGRNSEFHTSVPLEGARLFKSRAAQLSLKQVQDAFRAAHANQADLQGFSQTVYSRIQEVVTKVH